MVNYGYKEGTKKCLKCNVVSYLTVVDTSNGKGLEFAYWCSNCEDQIDKSAVKELS